MFATCRQNAYIIKGKYFYYNRPLRKICIYIHISNLTINPIRLFCFNLKQSAHPPPIRRFEFGFPNPLNAELNPICHFLALLGAHHILHVSRMRVKYMTKLETKINFYYFVWYPFFIISLAFRLTIHSSNVRYGNV